MSGEHTAQPHAAWQAAATIQGTQVGIVIHSPHTHGSFLGGDEASASAQSCSPPNSQTNFQLLACGRRLLCDCRGPQSRLPMCSCTRWRSRCLSWQTAALAQQGRAEAAASASAHQHHWRAGLRSGWCGAAGSCRLWPRTTRWVRPCWDRLFVFLHAVITDDDKDEESDTGCNRDVGALEPCGSNDRSRNSKYLLGHSGT